MSIERLRRITDLFVEGTELHLGEDDAGPVLVWVNKLNPFQVQEAQKDAQARRFLAIGRLKESGEYDGMVAEVGLLPDEQLCQEYVAMCVNEIYLDALNDIDLDKELREQREAIERAAELAEGQPADSPVHSVAESIESTWMAKLRELQERKTAERLAEAQAMGRADLEEQFLERWREWHTRSEFEREHRITQIYYAARRCDATRAATAVGEAWDHSACDHSQRLLNDRSDVRELPDELLTKLIDALDSITVPARAAGNSDAPASSSDSSEPSRAPEEASTPSSPAETPSVAPAT